MSSLIVNAKNLTKLYGGRAAVNGIDFDVREGEVFGILGPNGAGKTTTILMLLGLTEMTSGTLEVVGLDPRRDPLAVKRDVAYMPDRLGFYDHLTARENLAYTARLTGIPPEEMDRRIDAALERVRLTDVADRRAGTYSQGMKQRLGLAEVIMKHPRLAILDEPTNGLDPQSAREFLDLIRDLRSTGMTVVLSSHLLDRVQAVCDRVALFSRGRIALEGSVAELAHKVLGGGLKIELQARHVNCADQIRQLDGVTIVDQAAPDHILITATKDIRGEIARLVTEAGGELLALSIHEPGLEEIYNAYFEEEEKDAA